MSHGASDRYGLRGAPRGLALVQDFLNTRAIEPYAPDLLVERGDAEAWVAQAVEQWAQDRATDPPRISLSMADLKGLRALRSTFEAMVAGLPVDVDGSVPADPTPVPASLVPALVGQVRLVPTGTGWRWLASALWIETFRAQQDGIWPRLKLCRNPICASAFYDESRNNSGVWHNVRTCGNVANLRAARQRRRVQTRFGDDESVH